MKRIYIFPILLLLAVIQVKATELSCDSTKLPEKYSIISKYTSEELSELGYTSSEIKTMPSISIYDEILIN